MQVCNYTSEKSFVTSKGKNVPRYLYHITSEKNYKSIIKDGVVKPHQDAYMQSNLNGVFLFDLKNFIKCWCKSGITFGDTIFTLAQALFLKCSSKTSKIVVLRIPAKKLEMDKLRCRVQDLSGNISEEHIMNGDSALNQKHYTRKRMPIEYIYNKAIPATNIEKAGNADTGVDFDDMINAETTYNSINFRQILKDLFKGCPEEKAVNISSKGLARFKNITPY